MRLEPVALARPATLATEEQHRRVLARAVVLEPCRLGAALEVVLRRAGPREQAPHRLELIGPMEVRRARDRDLGIAQIGSRANDGQRLERLRRAPEERAELRVTAGVDDLPVRHGDGVHAMPSPRRPHRARPRPRSAPRRRSLTSLANGRDFPYVPRSSTVTRTTTSTTSSSSKTRSSSARSATCCAPASSCCSASERRARPSSQPSSETPKGTVGHHLKVLETAGLVRVVADAQGARPHGEVLRPRGTPLRPEGRRVGARGAARRRARGDDAATGGGRADRVGRRRAGYVRTRPRSARPPRSDAASSSGSTASSPTSSRPTTRTVRATHSPTRSSARHAAAAARRRCVASGRSGGLWRHRDFLKLWSAETVSQFGSQVGQLALPLVAILVLDASAFEVAALATVEFLPFILFTLPAGVWVDRLPRRPILIVGDLARAALLATIPIAYVADVLTLGQLFVVGFLVGSFQVFFDVAYQSYLPVARRTASRSSRGTRSSRSAARPRRSAGRASAASSSRSSPRRTPILARRRRASSPPGLFILGIRKEEPRPEVVTVDGSKPSLWYELKEGLRFVLGNPNLRAQAGLHRDLELLLERRVLDHPRVRRPRARPVAGRDRARLLASGPSGSLIAAFTATVSRIGSASGRRSIADRDALRADDRCSIAVRPGRERRRSRSSSRLSSSSGSRSSSTTSSRSSYRQAICPPRLQGRMNSVMRFIVWGTIPLGTLAGRRARDAGSASARRSWSAPSAAHRPFLWIVFSPQRHLREMPEPIDDTAVEPVAA